MRAYPDLAFQNVVHQALTLAEKTGELRYVIQDGPNRFSVSSVDPGKGNAVYIARPLDYFTRES
jgi:hypothetical protein